MRPIFYNCVLQPVNIEELSSKYINSEGYEADISFVDFLVQLINDSWKYSINADNKYLKARWTLEASKDLLNTIYDPAPNALLIGTMYETNI